MLASPDDALAARVTPWDAAYRLHAELCRRVANPYLQRIDAILPLGALGHVVVMERLRPASEDRATAFCAALKPAGDSGWQAPAGTDTAEFAGDPAVARLRSHLLGLVRQGQSLPFWGGMDVRPGNVMADAAGQLKLIDPIFVAGPRIVAAISNRDRPALAALPPGAVAAFLTIPAFGAGAEELWKAAAEMGLA